jgi:DNA end-binding protein Ku
MPRTSTARKTAKVADIATARKAAAARAPSAREPSASPRALWKGAISFGLIHIPVQLYPAEKSERLDLDMLDKRDFAPVGYKRVNKETGQEVPWDEIVKGYEYEEGHYVVLTEEELKEANPEAARSIQLLAFVPAGEIPLEYFEQPYYLAPVRGGDGVYALLREALRRSEKVGVAQVVIRTRQTLAAIVPQGKRLVMIGLRYPHEIRVFDESALPSDDLAELGLSDREVDMAMSLVSQMSEHWRPQKYKDRFFDDVMALINRKIARHETHALHQPGKAKPLPKAPKNVVDLVALLKQSLEQGRRGREAANEPLPPDTAANDAEHEPASGKGHGGTSRAVTRRRHPTGA